MPLEKGSSQAVISRNISEMRHAGHPENVAVAAAMHTAKDSASTAAWGKCFAHDCWKTMGKDSVMGSDPSSSIPAASEEEDQAGMIAGKDATSGRGPTDKDPDQPTGFDGKLGLDILKKGMLRLGKPGHR